MEQVEEIYSIKEIAEILKVSPYQVRSYIKDGRLEAHNIGRGLLRPLWKIKQSQLDKFWEVNK